MDLNKLYKLQAELDNHIWDKHRTLDKMSKGELLDNTILALLVEIGELANTTRCFKHWSTKGMMEKEIVLDELADVLHFYFSIGNQMTIRISEWILTEVAENISNSSSMTEIFKELYKSISKLVTNEDVYFMGLIGYRNISMWIRILWEKLGFTDKEVEQAYLKKHEENYKRQREGY